MIPHIPGNIPAFPQESYNPAASRAPTAYAKEVGGLSVLPRWGHQAFQKTIPPDLVLIINGLPKEGIRRAHGQKGLRTTPSLQMVENQPRQLRHSPMRAKPADQGMEIGRPADLRGGSFALQNMVRIFR